MRIISDSVPRALAATAQVSLFGVGGATAVLALLSGWLYARFGPAGFWAMAVFCTPFPVICQFGYWRRPATVPRA
jgi:hypothetical protein